MEQKNELKNSSISELDVVGSLQQIFDKECAKALLKTIIDEKVADEKGADEKGVDEKQILI